jgi:hypothetical protein
LRAGDQHQQGLVIKTGVIHVEHSLRDKFGVPLPPRVSVVRLGGKVKGEK